MLLHLLAVAGVDTFVILAEAEFALDSLALELFRVVGLVTVEVIGAVLAQGERSCDWLVQLRNLVFRLA